MAAVKLFKLGANGIPRQHNSTTDDLVMNSVQGGNLLLSGNTLSSTDTNGDVILNPDGTGNVNINGVYDLPNADGTAGQVLTTNGLGAVSFATPASAAATKICTDYTANGAIADRAPVYISGASLASETDASAESSSRCIGIADGAAVDTATVSVCHDGVLGGFTGLTAGARYFLSETPGVITATPPTADESAVVQVGYAKSATELHIDIEVIVEVETD